MMTTRCADCHHTDHHSIETTDGKWLGQEPCFHKDSTQPDGFCPCRKRRAPATAAEFTDAILGPEPKPAPVVAEEPDETGEDDDGGQAEAAERNLLDTGSWSRNVWEGHDDRD